MLKAEKARNRYPYRVLINQQPKVPRKIQTIAVRLPKRREDLVASTFGSLFDTDKPQGEQGLWLFLGV